MHPAHRIHVWQFPEISGTYLSYQDLKIGTPPIVLKLPCRHAECWGASLTSPGRSPKLWQEASNATNSSLLELDPASWRQSSQSLKQMLPFSGGVSFVKSTGISKTWDSPYLLIVDCHSHALGLQGGRRKFGILEAAIAKPLLVPNPIFPTSPYVRSISLTGTPTRRTTVPCGG